ncbi:unnamed protein product [Urochloa humidicola]
MALPGSSATAPIASPISFPVSKKLRKSNLVLWKLQDLLVIRGTQLEGFLDGTDVAPPKQIIEKVDGREVKRMNPKYSRWVTLDQQVLGYLLTTMNRDATS